MSIDFKKNGIKIKELPGEVSVFLVGKSGWILTFIAALLLGYFGFLWYLYVANPEWSDSRKQEYISTRENAVSFDQKRFDLVISEVEKRKNEYENKIDDVPDIFRLK
jgi:hypothetical protein